MCLAFLGDDGAMGTSGIIKFPAFNFVAPHLRNHKSIQTIQPTEGYIFFVLDTGADVTCLSFLDARKLGIDTRYLDTDEDIIGIGGKCCAYKLYDIELGLYDRHIAVRQAQYHIERISVINVLDETSPKLPSLLGNDILKRFDIITDRKNGIAELKRLPNI